MERIRTQLILALCLAAGCLALIGCQSDQSAAEQRYSAKLTEASYPRSMVFDSPRLRYAAGPADAQPEEPWYADRNDWQPNVIAGFRGPTFDETVTWTYDHQSQSSGHVHNTVDESTYRSSYTQGSR